LCQCSATARPMSPTHAMTTQSLTSLLAHANDMIDRAGPGTLAGVEFQRRNQVLLVDLHGFLNDDDLAQFMASWRSLARLFESDKVLSTTNSDSRQDELRRRAWDMLQLFLRLDGFEAKRCSSAALLADFVLLCPKAVLRIELCAHLKDVHEELLAKATLDESHDATEAFEERPTAQNLSRTDPEDGDVYTLSELKNKYSDVYSESEVIKYFFQQCQPIGPEADLEDDDEGPASRPDATSDGGPASRGWAQFSLPDNQGFWWFHEESQQWFTEADPHPWEFIQRGGQQWWWNHEEQDGFPLV